MRFLCDNLRSKTHFEKKTRGSNGADTVAGLKFVHGIFFSFLQACLQAAKTGLDSYTLSRKNDMAEPFFTQSMTSAIACHKQIFIIFKCILKQSLAT